ncbi:MAG TPA: hypothetical protein DD396_06275 [Bacteroidetes bacterium]|jgi:hypothetical protein|nr:hypothetical protein [Bacteroidota bacterium]
MNRYLEIAEIGALIRKEKYTAASPLEQVCADADLSVEPKWGKTLFLIAGVVAIGAISYAVYQHHQRNKQVNQLKKVV